MASAPLPLALRKEIRDKQPKLDEAKKKLDAAFGFEVTLEMNNESIYGVLTEANHSKKESFIEPIAQYLDNLSTQIATINKDADAKEELTKVLSTKKIVFVVRKEPFTDAEKKVQGNNSYIGVAFKEGALHVIVPVTSFWSNITHIANPKEISILNVLATTCTPPGALPVTLRTAMRDAKPKFDAAIKSISDALGFEVHLDFDATAAYHALAATGYKDRLPDAVPIYLSGLGANLAKVCKDDMVKEALLEKFKTKKIKFAVHPDAFADKNKYGGDSYVGLSFDNGDITVLVPSKSFYSNVDNIKNLNIEKLL